MLVAPQYLDGGRHLAVQLTAVFRYGREDDEILGLRFAKEFCLASLLVDQSPTPEPLTGQLVPTLSSFVFFFFWLLSNDEAEFVTAATELVCKSFLSKLRRRQLVHADAFGHCCCEQKEIVSQFSSDCFPFRIQWPSDLTADLSLQQPAYSKGEPCGIR